MRFKRPADEKGQRSWKENDIRRTWVVSERSRISFSHWISSTSQLPAFTLSPPHIAGTQILLLDSSVHTLSAISDKNNGVCQSESQVSED